MTPKIITDVKLGGESFGVTFTLVGKEVYSADKIQSGIAIFDSDILDGGIDLLSWKNISWVESKPDDTDILVYVRSAGSQTELLKQGWSGPMLNKDGEDISRQTGRFLQFRISLLSIYDAVTHVLKTPLVETFLISRFVSSGEQNLFTKNINLGFKPKHILLTYNGVISRDVSIRFAVSGNDSVSEEDYQVIDPNKIEKLNDINQNADSIRMMIGAIGSKEIPFVVDEFSIILSGNGQKKINKDWL